MIERTDWRPVLSPAALLLSILLPNAAAPLPPATPPTFYATATVDERPLDTAAGSVTVIERQTVDAAAARTVAELLRYAAGVVVSPAGTRGGFTTAAIRGGDPNFTLVLLDGVPLNDVTDPVGGAFNLEGLPAAAVERIEIVRGPLSSYYGSTGLAGAINVITRRGGADGEPSVQIDVEGGDADQRRGFAGAGGRLGERGDYFAGVSYEEERERVAAERFEQLELSAKAAFALRDGGSLRLTTRIADWRARDYPEASGGPRFGSGELRRTDHDELGLGLDLRFGAAAAGGAPRHRLNGAFYQHRLDRRSPGVFPLVPPSRESTTYRRSRLGWASAVLGGRGLVLHAGAEIENEEGDNDSVLALPPFLGGEVTGDYRIDRTTGGLYAELIRQRGDLVLELGARLDLPQGRGAELSPRLAVAYRPGGGATRLRGSVGRAFKLPSFFALASPPQLGGNPELEPEVAIGADVGVEHEMPGADLTLGVTLFANRFDDLVDFDFERFTHLNRARVDAVGLELHLRWTPRSWLTFAADLTRQEVEDRTTGAGLRGRPEWAGSARLRLAPGAGAVLWLDGQLVGARLDQQIPVPSRTVAPGYALVGLAGSWQLARRWQLRGRIDNLMDRDYETFIGFPGASRGLRLGLRHRIGG